jgi:bifunctional oligoribonuclease and PAP phosphatase NrnA
VINVPEKIVEIINDIDYFVLVTHVHPDGDAIGSLLAMESLLKQMGKRVFAYLDEPVSHLYDFLPGSRRLTSDINKLQAFVEEAGTSLAAIALDCGEADRVGDFKDKFLQISPFLVIDHHLSHGNFGDYRWVEPGRSSTGEMVYELGETLGVKPSYEGAFALYVAISTDTGSFRYECTGARTFEIAGKLVEGGIKPGEISSLIYDNYSPERLDLMQMVLETLDLHEDNQIACIHVTREMFEKSGAPVQDVEGFVEYPRSIKTVKVAAFFKETKSDMISVSIRAKGDCNVASVAQQFGGGGHRNAAGCRFPGESIESVRGKVVAQIRAELNSTAV